VQCAEWNAMKKLGVTEEGLVDVFFDGMRFLIKM
jgi:hypothetical protein